MGSSKSFTCNSSHSAPAMEEAPEDLAVGAVALEDEGLGVFGGLQVIVNIGLEARLARGKALQRHLHFDRL